MPALTDKNWVSILEYSIRYNLSISTIRRQIKAKKIKCTLMKGKYFIFDENLEVSEKKGLSTNEEELMHLHLLKEENVILHKKIKSLTEENHELKMLIKLYEGKSNGKVDNAETIHLPHLAV